MLSLLERYIAQRVVVATGLVLAVLGGLFLFFDLLEALHDYGRENFGFYEVLRYVLLSQPRKLYEISPVAMVIGALLGLSTLAVNAELIAMRAAGVAVTKIVGAAIKVGLVVAVLAMALGEFVVPMSEDQAQRGRARALNETVQQQRSGLWLRDNGNFVNIREVLPDLSLLQVNIYSVEDGIDLRQQLRAERALYTPQGWRLENVQLGGIDKGHMQTQRMASQPWVTTLTQEAIAVFAVAPEQLSIRQLRRYIEHLQVNGQNTERYRLVFWQKLLLPLAVLMMVLLATPFALGHTRTGGTGQRIFIGVILGLAFEIVSRSFGHFGLIYGLPPILGALLPTALFLIGALLMLRRNT